MIDKKQLVNEAGRPIKTIIGLTQAFFLLAFFIAPFIWIWKDWNLAWKVGLTAIIGILITKFLYYVAKKVIDEVAEYEIKKQFKKTSRNDGTK